MMFSSTPSSLRSLLLRRYSPQRGAMFDRRMNTNSNNCFARAAAANYLRTVGDYFFLLRIEIFTTPQHFFTNVLL